MDISDWRCRIDKIDRKIVELLNQRAQAAYEIGLVKRDAGLPIYEPDREQAVFANAQKANSGPLSHRDLLRIFERIIDIMRQIQGQVIAPTSQISADTLAETELDSKVED
jgi:chorismate mutase